MAVFFFLIQVFTGALLAFNYAPTPGDAYNSLRYIMTEVTGGPLIRGLHHWGASMMLIIVVLHMIQVFLYGAYKKPREATWMVGVILLLLTLAYGLTGYLLPWDNRAYWGTVVTTHIASQAPILGPYLLRLLGGQGDSVGKVTFARFYALHTVLLPPLTIILIAIHIYLVRKHGVAAAPGDTAPKRKFFPEQVFKDTVGVAIAFIILFIMAVVAKVPLERLADPTDTTYIPRPEWYFLFLFQTLKFFKRPIGSGRQRGPAWRRGAHAVPGSVHRSRADASSREANICDHFCTSRRHRLDRFDHRRGGDHAQESGIGGRHRDAGHRNSRSRTRIRQLHGHFRSRRATRCLAAIDARRIGWPRLLQVGRLHQLPYGPGRKRHRPRSHQDAQGASHGDLDGSALQESVADGARQRHAPHQFGQPPISTIFRSSS